MSQNFKKFSVITVCKNSKDLLEETILSVLNQTVFLKKIAILEYIIIDGNSNDGSTNLISDFAKKYSPILHFVENDNSLYDGLVKGLKKCTGHFVSYINAGDFYNKTAFEVVNNVFISNPEVHWITGNKIIYNKNSQITNFYTPYKYRSRLIRAGVYGKYLPFIQQESVFWKFELNKEIDFNQLQKLKRCGDLFIWKCFAKKFKLYNVNSYLSGFKYHDNQLTFSNTGTTRDYITESYSFTNKLTFFDFLIIFLDIFFWTFLKYKNFIFAKNSYQIEYDKFNEEWLLKDKKKNILHVWFTDSLNNDGESKLSFKFCKKISRYYDFIVIYSLFNKIIIKNENIISNIKKKNYIKLNFYHKYIVPFIGIFFIWYLHFIKRKKTGFINFLPLWNTLIFILLPSRIILGPITGYNYIKNVNSLETFLRKFFFPFFMNLSIKIINLKFNNIYFYTNNLIKFSEKLTISYKSNYMMELISIDNSNLADKKKIDLVIYYRNYNSKKPKFFQLIIEYLSSKGFKITTYGDTFITQFPNIDQKGLINDDFVKNLLSQAKYTLLSPENFYSLTMYEAIQNRVKVFYDKNLSNNLTKNFKNEIFFEIDFDDFHATKVKMLEIISKDYTTSKKYESLIKDLIKSA